jgi:hypothetical protein
MTKAGTMCEAAGSENRRQPVSLEPIVVRDEGAVPFGHGFAEPSVRRPTAAAPRRGLLARDAQIDLGRPLVADFAAEPAAGKR